MPAAADVAALVRGLNAATVSETTKLETARTLVSFFVSASGPNSDVQPSSTTVNDRSRSLAFDVADLCSMPSRVRGHYVKLLLDWVATALTKAKHDSSSNDDASTYLQQLRQRWQLLFVLLASTDSSAQSAPNTTLVAAAAAACKGCSIGNISGADGADLALVLQQTLLVLNTKYRRSFRPSLDHSIALATGSLAHVISCRHMTPPPASLKAWEGLATQACIQLLEVCTSHPNQKKVYTAVINKPLLLLLSQAIWPATQQTDPQEKHPGIVPTAANVNPDQQAERPSGTVPTAANIASPYGPDLQLTAVAQELVRAVVFHSSIIEGIIELVSGFSNSSHEPGGVTAGKAPKASAPRSYHFQLLQVIDETLSSTPDAASAEAFMHFLSWLATQFAHTVKHPSRSSSSQQQLSQRAATATNVSAPLSADFYFFATLLQPLLSHMQAEASHSSSVLPSNTASGMTNFAGTSSATGIAQAAAAAASQPKKRKGQQAGKGRAQTMPESHGLPVEWAGAAKGAALLVAAMQADNVYRPTEDTTGRHRQLLAALADAAVQRAESVMQHTSVAGAAGAGSNQQKELVAVCNILSAILSVEHRAVQPHLAHIWQLLWLAARGHDAQAVATAVATGLVAAYADLRQLQFLLQSLLDALLAQVPPTAAAVICAPPFVQALQKAVREMPSGQAAPMIAFIAHYVPALAALPGSCPQAAFGEVLASCLTAIRVEVVSAPTLATAAVALLTSSLGPALTPMLLQASVNTSSTDASQHYIQTPAAEAASASAAAQLPQHVAVSNSNFEAQHAQQAAVEEGSWLHRDVEGSEQLMGCLLRLYRGAVGLYGQCAATQLQIAQLPGQGTGLSTDEASQQPETDGRNGYFAALLSAGQLHTALSLPALPSLYHPAPPPPACHPWSPLTTQLCLCAAQRISTLHEQLLHQQYTCPLIFAEPTHKAAAATPANPLGAADAPVTTPQAAASIANSQQSAETAQLSNDIPMAGMLVGDLHHDSSSEGKVIPEVTPEVAQEVTPEVATEVRDDRMHTEGASEVTTSIQTELQQLSDQLLWHAAALLQPSSMSSGMANSRPAHQPEDRFRNEMPTDFWPVVSPLLPTLATYATQPPLQKFLRQLISRHVPDFVLASGSTSASGLSSASASTSSSTSVSTSSSASGSNSCSTSSAAAAGIIAACLGQATFLEQLQQQQAWLHVIQEELSSAATALNSAAASSSESQHAQRGSTSKKRRRSQGAQSPTDAVTDRSRAEDGALQECGGSVTDAQLHTVLIQTLQVVTPFLASPQAATAGAAAELTMEASKEADGKHHSKAGSGGKKRKTAEGHSSKAAQAIPMLRYVTGLLRHVALMPLALLSASHAALLAQCLLQAQLLLAQSAIALAPAYTAAANAKADSEVVEMMVQALVSSQQGIAKCLKGSSDAAASLLLHAGPPQLWHWLPAAAQLTGHLQSLMPPSSTMGLSAALSSRAQGSSSTTRQASEQLLPSAAAGRWRGPAIWSNDASRMAHFASTSMVQEMSASICSLACFCMRERNEARNADTDFRGCCAFVTGLVNELQARSTAGPPEGRQSCEGNNLDTSSHSITWVMAEAVLAAAEQAATARVPVKRKKAAAEVVTGPVKAAEFQADPQLLATTVSSLKTAVDAHMRHHTTSYALAPPEHAFQSAPPDSNAYDMLRVLHGLDSTTMAAAFGCAAHLLQLHRKLKHALANPQAGGYGAHVGLLPSSAVTPSVIPTSGKSQQPQPVQRIEGSIAADHKQTSDDANKDDHVGMSHDAEVLEHVTGQVEWLTNILKLPWQLQSAGTHLQPGRMALSIASAHHLVAVMQAVAQAASHLEHGNGQLLWLPLHTLHLHMLATLMPVLKAPLPLRHAGSAPMGLPTLVPPPHPQVKPYTALRKALLLSLREIYRATSTEQQQSMYIQLVQALNAAQSPLDALALLEGLLVALETPHSPKGLHVLARHSQSFASALLQFLSSVTLPSTKAGTAAAAAEVAAAVATAHRCLESMLARENIFTLPPSQIVDILASPVFLFTSAIGRSLNSPTSPGHVTLTAMAPVYGDQCEAGSASGGRGPDGFPVQSGVQMGGVQWGLRQGAGVYMGCCSLIMAGLRHHAGAVRRCMALVGPSTRALLRTLMLWSQPQPYIRLAEDESLLVVCATELAQLYTTIASDKAGLGKYCVHLLADYITVAAAPPLPPATSSGVSLHSNSGWQFMEALSGLPGAALRQGALALYGACSPAEVQHIHAILAGVSDGMQRAALADLRRDYEADYRYTGKV